MTPRPTSLAPREPDPGRPTLSELARGAAETAAALERGQAEQPLAALARGLAGGTEPLALALLASDDTQRDTVLRWLRGVPPGVLAQADITVLPALSALDGTPGLAAQLAAKPSLLLLALATAAAPGDAERAALAGLAPLVGAVWPVVLGAADATVAQRTARAWTTGLTMPLPATPLDAEATAPLPEFLLQGVQQPLAAALLQTARVRRAASLVEMLHERHDSDLAQLRSRLKREQRLEKAAEGPGGDAAARAEIDQARQRANEDFSSLAQAIRETQRRSLLRGGATGQLLAELSSSLQPGDLLQQPEGKLVRLSLDRNFVDLTRQRFAKGLRRQLDEHCVVVRDSFELLRRRSEAALQAAGARTLSVPLEMPDNTALWQALRDVAALDLKYRGELPRRGFLQRLGAGRQLVFGVLMVLSLIGSFLGFNVRQAALAGVFLLLLFAAGVAWTFHAWKREDALALTREIDKVREGVLADLERGAAEVSRELQTRLLEFVEQAKRDFVARLEAAQREWQAGAAAQSDSERKELRGRVKLIEQREKEMQALGQQVAKLRLQAQQLASDAQTALREATRGPAAGAAA